MANASLNTLGADVEAAQALEEAIEIGLSRNIPENMPHHWHEIYLSIETAKKNLYQEMMGKLERLDEKHAIVCEKYESKFAKLEVMRTLLL